MAFAPEYLSVLSFLIISNRALYPPLLFSFINELNLNLSNDFLHLH